MWLALDLYRLYTGVVGITAQYYIYVLITPFACVLPDFFIRNAYR